jgi:hypothetical protein
LDLREVKLREVNTHILVRLGDYLKNGIAERVQGRPKRG